MKNKTKLLPRAKKAAALDVESAVRDRYSKGARAAQTELCIPVSYTQRYLKAIPAEIVERDYGCGDPTVYLREGDTVLDLGSGTGKACYIAAQVVGAKGRVIGVDMNEEMLGLARKHRQGIAKTIGFSNVEFRKGKIQDLALDVEAVEEYLARNPIRSQLDLETFETYSRELRANKPLIPSDSVDVVISNCVLNLVREDDKTQLFREIFRVLKRGGRAAISDIVADEPIPQEMRNDPDLWSGCISGAFLEAEFLKAFEDAGFYGITIEKRMERPWRVVNGIEFRSITVVAHKGKQGVCLERKQAAIYKGPWKEVLDDDGHRYPRGERVAVCDKTFQILGKAPYKGQFELVAPYQEIPLEKAGEFPCTKGVLKRHPKETKGEDYKLTTAEAAACCEMPSESTTNGSCC